MSTSSVSVSMEHVFKKFSRGERHDTLRDLFPALGRRMLGRGAARTEALGAQEFWALNDLSFTVGRGEAIGIIGHNGAGKSTLLKHLSGIMAPTSGEIVVNGKLSALIEVGAGFHQDLTGRENVFLNGVILGMTRAEVRRKFDEIVEFSGIADFIDMPVKRYSSGMYARLGFAVAAHMEPDILIVDEVLSVGDHAFQAKCMLKMRSILAGGATVVFVSHNLRAIAEICGRALLMQKGRLIADGSTDQVIQQYMAGNAPAQDRTEERQVAIESVTVGTEKDARSSFESGERVMVEVAIKATVPVSSLSVDLYLLDHQFYPSFDISTDRLGAPLISLCAGESRRFRFQIDLHLATGTFYLGAAIYRYDIGLLYDKLEPAATLFVSSTDGVRGVVNLHPRLVPIG